MKKKLLFYLNLLFGKELELRLRLFHVLAITGFIICVIMTGVSIASHMPISTVVNAGAGIISLFLLIYSAKSKHYLFCYSMTIGVIFFLLFSSLFFSGGGYQGGMPFFFVFAVVFTIYMLDGWSMILIVLLELIYYSLLFVFAYLHPELVSAFDSEKSILIDTIIGFVTVSVSLGATMFIQLHMYKKQQNELEEARIAAEAANHAKSIFLANMSHEIRTPIHMILGMNEIIHRESRNSEIRDYSKKVDETSKMLLSLVDSVLDVSKIESGKMELIPAPYESDTLIQTLILIGRTNCTKKGLQFYTHISDNLPSQLYGDLAHIRQIASNLLSNAAKYTENGSVTLTVDQKPGTQKNQIILCLTVQDTGIGIRKEAIPALFDAFNRADLASHRYIEGTGLGLNIVKELTDLMHGTLSIDSTEGKGSTFHIELPQKILYTESNTTAAPVIKFTAPDVHLLVVDDNAGNRLLLQKLLSPTKIQIDTAASGAECLRLVKERSYHLILMDYMMPELNGLETLELLQKLPNFHTPVIALTADATFETHEKLMCSGFTSYLIKPLPWSKLCETLITHLPEELILKETEPAAEKDYLSNHKGLSDSMTTYGILMEEAMSYFEDDLKQYAVVAQLFTRHFSKEYEQVQKLVSEKNAESLKYLVHSLKGKARNLGMIHLSETCFQVEKLCTEGYIEEVWALMPYLLYLWKLGYDGLLKIIPEIKTAKNSHSSLNKNLKYADLETALLHYLQEFRRKPSLDCLEQILENEVSEDGKIQLEHIRDLIDAIDFEQAENTFNKYLEWKKGDSK